METGIVLSVGATKNNLYIQAKKKVENFQFFFVYLFGQGNFDTKFVSICPSYEN